MTLVTITLTASEAQSVSGIPDTVEVSVNVAATIYYTLDGSLPTVLSTVYTDAIRLPTNQNTVILSVVAYYLDEFSALVPSSVLSETYATDWSQLDDRNRFLNFEGIVYSYPGGQNIPFLYDEAGNVAFSLDVPYEDLEVVLSEQDVTGNVIGTDDEIIPADPNETPTHIDNDRTPFSTPDDANFDPEAQFILIDSRAGAPAPLVKLINGPFMSLRNHKTSYGGIELFNHGGENYISGDVMRPQISPDGKTIAFYYFDSNVSRWVKSVGPLNLTPRTPVSVFTQPLVFEWVLYGRKSTI